eukprot:Pompholyxophrys_sp_v1_NODE_153_length_1503_cov_15.160221.p1 type:complete len:421 gc:universal NODE_153_length_1503_cov_15.160221:1382-120(-)
MTKEDYYEASLAICLLFILWQSRFRVSSSALEFIFSMMSSFFEVLFPAFSFLFPRSVYFLNKIVHKEIKSIVIDRVVCVKCHTVYPTSSAQQLNEKGDVIGTKNCSRKAFLRSTECGEPLLEQVGKNWRARKIYYSVDLKKSIQNLFQLQSFRQDLVLQKSVDGKIRDVVDGRIWSSPEWSEYLENQDNLALMMNFDFFSPFESRTRYSVGFLYLTVLNLKRGSRYKREHVIFLGVIPGPKEPSLHLNGYLHYFVKDLLELDKGTQISYQGQFFEIELKVRARLFCVTADLPAVRKVLAFLSCNADSGCSKCEAKKVEHFVQGKTKKDWSSEAGQPRTHTSVKEAGDAYKSCASENAAETLSTQTGIRYCVLSKLLYFNLILLHVIDPMHNLYLGVAKTMIQHFFEDEESSYVVDSTKKN